MKIGDTLLPGAQIPLSPIECDDCWPSERRAFDRGEHPRYKIESSGASLTDQPVNPAKTFGRNIGRPRFEAEILHGTFEPPDECATEAAAAAEEFKAVKRQIVVILQHIERRRHGNYSVKGRTRTYAARLTAAEAWRASSDPR